MKIRGMIQSARIHGLQGLLALITTITDIIDIIVIIVIIVITIIITITIEKILHLAIKKIESRLFVIPLQIMPSFWDVACDDVVKRRAVEGFF